MRKICSKELLKQHNIAYLSRNVGITRQSLYNYIHGGNMRYGHAVKIAKFIKDGDIYIFDNVDIKKVERHIHKYFTYSELATKLNRTTQTIINLFKDGVNVSTINTLIPFTNYILNNTKIKFDK